MRVSASQTHILHHTNGLFGLRHEFVLCLLNLLLRLGANLVVVRVHVCVLRGRDGGHGDLPRRALGLGLGGVQRQARLLDALARAGRKHDVGVEGRVPAGQEPALDLRILGQAGLADALFGQGELLEGRGQGVVAGAAVLLVEELAASQGSAGNGVGEGLGLGLRRGRGRQGGLGLGGGRGGREELDLFADGSAEVAEGLFDVGWVVVGFGSILVTDKGAGLLAKQRGVGADGASKSPYSRHSQHLLVNLLQGIDALFQVDVVGGELGLCCGHTSACDALSPSFRPPPLTDLVLGLPKLLLGVLQSSRGEGGELSPKDTASQFPPSAMAPSFSVRCWGESDQL